MGPVSGRRGGERAREGEGAGWFPSWGQLWGAATGVRGKGKQAAGRWLEDVKWLKESVDQTKLCSGGRCRSHRSRVALGEGLRASCRRAFPSSLPCTEAGEDGDAAASLVCGLDVEPTSSRGPLRFHGKPVGVSVEGPAPAPPHSAPEVRLSRADAPSGGWPWGPGKVTRMGKNCGDMSEPQRHGRAIDACDVSAAGRRTALV